MVAYLFIMEDKLQPGLTRPQNQEEIKSGIWDYNPGFIYTFYSCLSLTQKDAKVFLIPYAASPFISRIFPSS